MNLHGGNGLEVSFVDYMEGRLTGIYKQNYPKQQQQLSLKYSTFLDTFYGTSRSLNNASSFFSSSYSPYPYSNPFVMPYLRHSFRSNSYSDQPYKGMKPSSSSASSAPQDLLSQMTTEYCREFARELARKAVSAITTTTTTIPGSNLQSSIIQGGLGNNNHIVGVQHKQQQQQEEDVFGYRFEICKDCLSMEPLQVKFGKDGTKDNNSNRNSNNNNDDPVDDVVARIEQKHTCDPKLVASNRKEVQDKEGSVKTIVDKLPRIASMITQGWSENQKNRISLIAVKIPHKNKNKIKNNDHQENNDNIADNAADDNDNNSIQPQQDTIVIPNPKNPKQQITFQCSQEKHINLSLISNETSKNHYAARAIRYGLTILTNEEMEDFLNMVQTSTFAIFEIHESSPTTTTTASSSLQPSQQHHHHKQQDESIGLYFLAIIPYDDTLYSQSWLPNESNDSKDNNNNNNKSVQSNSANETFLSLCNHLDNISNFAIPMNSQRSSSLSSS
jgi:hypothetical protein